MANNFENFILEKVINNNDDLIVLGSRPAMGKTTFIITVAKYLAIDREIPTAVFSLEMAKKQVDRRILSVVSNLPCEKIYLDDLSAEEKVKINSSKDYVSSKPLYIDDTAGLDISEMKIRLQQLVKDKGVRFVLIDYLHLINASDEKIRDKQLRYICKVLKDATKELHITIILASQCHRSVSSKTRIIPTLEDLSLSSEDIIDDIWLLYRPSYYKIFDDEQGNDVTNIADLHLYKGDTKVSEEKFIFDKSIPKFI